MTIYFYEIFFGSGKEEMVMKCKICGSETEKIYHPRWGHKYHYCKYCDFIAKDESELISQEEELQIYNQHNNSIEDPKYVAYFYKFLKEAVFEYTSEGKSGFDFGSGPSPVLAELLKKNHGYTMDIYDKFYSTQKVYLNQKYDLVTATEVVEHLTNPVEYFELFAGLLKEKGVLSVMTLFHKCDEEHFWNWHYIRDKSHISFYTSKTMQTIAEQVGLKVIYTNDIRYTTFILNR